MYFDIEDLISKLNIIQRFEIAMSNEELFLREDNSFMINRRIFILHNLDTRKGYRCRY